VKPRFDWSRIFMYIFIFITHRVIAFATHNSYIQRRLDPPHRASAIGRRRRSAHRDSIASYNDGVAGFSETPLSFGSRATMKDSPVMASKFMSIVNKLRRLPLVAILGVFVARSRGVRVTAFALLVSTRRLLSSRKYVCCRSGRC